MLHLSTGKKNVEQKIIVSSISCVDSTDTPPTTNYTNEDEMYGITWMYFPDGNGEPQIAYLTEESGRSRGNRNKDVKDCVRFELYTR